MAESEAQTATPGAAPGGAAPRHGEPCEQCGAPLASDQHYCLECGQRRGGPRVDYRHYMSGPAQPAEPARDEPTSPAGAEEPAKPQRDYAPLAAVGGIAVLGLMLLVGVLIGKGNNNSAAAPAQQVIRVPATSEGAGSETGGGASKNTSSGLGGAKTKKAKDNSNAGGANTGNAVKASESDLEELNSESGESYAKKSEELPNEIATPGAPPPIDKSKPPGGGEGGGEVIK